MPIDTVSCMSPSSLFSRKTGVLKKGNGKQKQLGTKKHQFFLRTC